MSGWRLSRKRTGGVRVDLRQVVPSALAGRTAADIERLQVGFGSQFVPLAEVFDVAAGGDDMTVVMTGDLSACDRIGWQMSAGRLVVEGSAGDYVGAGMTAGEVEVRGSAGALAACGVDVEDKGLSMALHYRQSPQPDSARDLIGELTAQLPASLQVFAGKMVVNAMAARAPDKADAVRRLQVRCGAAHVFYAGDDINDEPVFEAAAPRWLTLRIGRDERASRARFFLDSIDEVGPMLERMLGHCPGAPHPA